MKRRPKFQLSLLFIKEIKHVRGDHKNNYKYVNIYNFLYDRLLCCHIFLYNVEQIMRSLLYKFEGTSVLFTGIVRVVCNSEDKASKIVLVEDVRHRELPITDHLWIKIPSYLAKGWIQVNEQVRFSGKVCKYTNKENKLNYGVKKAIIHQRR